MRTPQLIAKIARITFGNDGSIYGQFPYLTEKRGAVCELPVDPAVEGPVQYNVRELGQLVDTDVKFSHHGSGITQFSKTGSGLVGPRRESFPLDGTMGHLFILQVHKLDGFEPLTKMKRDVLYLAFDFREYHPEALIVRADWRRKTDVASSIRPVDGVSGPATKGTNLRTGSRESIFFVGQPPNSPLRDHVLMVVGGSVDLPSGADRSSLIFLGGWDPHEQEPSDPARRLGSCLSFLYPVSDAAAT